MGRKAVSRSDFLKPDWRYRSLKVSKLIRIIMRNGEFALACGITYHAIDHGSKEVGVTPVEFVDKVIENVMPAVEVRARRVGGATYQIPIDVKPKRGLFLAIKFLKLGALSRKGISMKQRLMYEMVDAYNNRGNAVRMRDDRIKAAESNRAFANFRVS